MEKAGKRLLAAARRSLERTGGALDRSIGLSSPTDAERRVVIGITGSYRPQTVGRLTIGLAALDAALRQRHGTSLHDALIMLGGPLRDRPAEREREQRQRAAAISRAAASTLASEAWFGSWCSALADDGTITRLLRRGDDRLQLATGDVRPEPADIFVCENPAVLRFAEWRTC